MSIIETERLILRHFCENDRPFILSYHCEGLSEKEDEKYIKLLKALTNNMFSGWIEEYKNGINKRWAITLKKTKVIIGDITINNINTDNTEAEIGYNILESYRNNGYATEATKALIQELFNTGIERIVAYHQPNNHASRRVMEKCKMTFVGNEVMDLGHKYTLNVSKFVIENSSKTLDKPVKL